VTSFRFFGRARYGRWLDSRRYRWRQPPNAVHFCPFQPAPKGFRGQLRCLMVITNHLSSTWRFRRRRWWRSQLSPKCVIAVFGNYVCVSSMIRTVIIEDEPLAGQCLATLVDDTRHVDVIGTAADGAAGLRLCTELHPDAVFLDINLPGQDGVSLATQLTTLTPSPRLVFIAGNADHATDAFRLGAVDYLLKPLDPLQVAEAINRLLVQVRPSEFGSFLGSANRSGVVLTADKIFFTNTAYELLPVTDIDRDQIRLLARHEIVAVLRRERRTWIHTVLEEFATYYSLAELIDWLRGDPFIRVGRHAVVNLRAVERVKRCGDRVYRVRLHDRLETEITASRTGATRLAGALKIERYRDDHVFSE
jgi:two-component system, LytTR family, response regulator